MDDVERARGREGGFSLVEVVVASGVLAAALLALAQLFAGVITDTRRAREMSDATVLASQKVEQLRALAFGTDDAGLPVTDAEYDTAAEPERAGGGTGLAVSPPATVDRDTPGFVDFLDDRGTPVGPGPPAPAGTRYRRRWSISRLEGHGDDGRVIRVRVLQGATGPVRAELVALRVRRAP